MKRGALHFAKCSSLTGKGTDTRYVVNVTYLAVLCAVPSAAAPKQLNCSGWTGARAYYKCILVSSPRMTIAVLGGVDSGRPVQSVHVLSTAPGLYGRSRRSALQWPAEMLGCGHMRRLSSWATLGLVPREADAVAVKKAYFEAAKACHPDLHGATAANVQRFQELSLAVDDILRELSGDRETASSSVEDGAGATTSASSSTEMSRDDPDFASSFFEFINREMSDPTRAEIKAAVSRGSQLVVSFVFLLMLL